MMHLRFMQLNLLSSLIKLSTVYGQIVLCNSKAFLDVHRCCNYSLRQSRRKLGNFCRLHPVEHNLIGILYCQTETSKFNYKSINQH